MHASKKPKIAFAKTSSGHNIMETAAQLVVFDTVWLAKGTIMSIQGIALMFYQPIFFPPLTRWLGVVNSFRFGAWLFTGCILTLPLIGRLAHK